MKKLYYIQYLGTDLELETKLKSLGRTFHVFDGFLVESISDSKTIYEFLTKYKPNLTIVVFEIDKNNYYGRYDKEIWNFFK